MDPPAEAQLEGLWCVCGGVLRIHRLTSGVAVHACNPGTREAAAGGSHRHTWLVG
jgi:hypothetical protein